VSDGFLFLFLFVILFFFFFGSGEAFGESREMRKWQNFVCCLI